MLRLPGKDKAGSIEAIVDNLDINEAVALKESCGFLCISTVALYDETTTGDEPHTGYLGEGAVEKEGIIIGNKKGGVRFIVENVGLHIHCLFIAYIRRVTNNPPVVTAKRLLQLVGGTRHRSYFLCLGKNVSALEFDVFRTKIVSVFLSHGESAITDIPSFDLKLWMFESYRDGDATCTRSAVQHASLTLDRRKQEGNLLRLRTRNESV